ncbi:elongation factor Ts [bacterium]|jgi:elongation factor Ts|nr:elongation factor Ts [bacterium]
MKEITVEVIKQLREQTGVGMMDCKKALIEANGDIEAAAEVLRKKGIAVAAKRSDNETNNGRVAASVANGAGALVEIACETDFAANTEDMGKFADLVAGHVASTNAALDPETILEQTSAGSKLSIKENLDELISKITESIRIKRFARYAVEHGVVNAYIHPGASIGVMIALETNSELSDDQKSKLATVAKDVCMHIAVMNPLCIDSDGIPADTLAKEQEIIKEQLRQSGKPEAMLDKIMVGKLRKYYEEICLINQKFIKNDKQSIGDYVTSSAKEVGVESVTVKAFVRYGIGR